MLGKEKSDPTTSVSPSEKATRSCLHIGRYIAPKTGNWIDVTY